MKRLSSLFHECAQQYHLELFINSIRQTNVRFMTQDQFLVQIDLYHEMYLMPTFTQTLFESLNR